MPRAGYAEWDEDDAFDMVDERPSRRLRRTRLPWLRIVLMSACSIAGLAYLALEQERTARPAGRAKAVPSSVLVTPAPAWKPLAPSPGVYALAGASGSVTSEARQHTSGAREDTVALGRFGDYRYAQLALVQGTTEAAGSFYVDTVRHAARAGLAVAHQGQGRMVATKFGSVEAAPMTLSGKGSKPAKRSVMQTRRRISASRAGCADPPLPTRRSLPASLTASRLRAPPALP
ncbi:hypothetical protein ACFQY9_01270 [Microvirga aerilata]|uniref:hypothetical protein n=1 Tax=Microvirga aerilata TaxID=670292 RepID=UPI00362E5409